MAYGFKSIMLTTVFGFGKTVATIGSNLFGLDSAKQLLHAGKVWLHNFNIPDLSNVFGLDKKISLRPLRFLKLSSQEHVLVKAFTRKENGLFRL